MRLRAASMAGSLLAPLRRDPVLLGSRLVSVWPYGLSVDPDRPADAPFLDAAALLAELHAQTPSPPGLPRHGAVQRVAAALTRAGTLSAQDLAAARRAVTGAARTLPAWARDPNVADPPGRPRRLVHGDWHLGQMVQMVRPSAREAAVNTGAGRSSGEPNRPASHPADWRLVDIDDLGLGDPAWDLAWPASWFAAGLLAAPEWSGLLAAYVSAGGAALPADADVWAVLDPFARAATVHRAAVALARADEDGRALDEAEEAFVDACARIAAQAAARPAVTGPQPLHG